MLIFLKYQQIDIRKISSLTKTETFHLVGHLNRSADFKYFYLCHAIGHSLSVAQRFHDFDTEMKRFYCQDMGVRAILLTD